MRQSVPDRSVRAEIALSYSLAIIDPLCEVQRICYSSLLVAKMQHTLSRIVMFETPHRRSFIPGPDWCLRASRIVGRLAEAITSR